MKLDVLEIGEFLISHRKNGSMWIEVITGPNTGEGGEFNPDKLLEVIRQFYKENF